MVRLLWLSPERIEPEDAFPALIGTRPAPEPIPFREASVELISRRLAEVILVDGREEPDQAAATIRKIHNETEASILIILEDEAIATFDFTCGAGDFVTSRCSKQELEARLGRLLGPAQVDDPQLIRRGEVTVNRERFEVKVRGQALDLTFKEFELFAYLASRPGKVCSRHTLLSDVWGYDFFGGTRTVDVHIRRLRAKLGQDAHVIDTVRNVGYRFAG